MNTIQRLLASALIGATGLVANVPAGQADETTATQQFASARLTAFTPVRRDLFRPNNVRLPPVYLIQIC